MSNKRLITSQAGKQTPIDSEAEELDFASVRIGADKIPLTQLNATTLQVGAKIRGTAGTDASDYATKGQLDAEASTRAAADVSHQSQLDGHESRLDTAEADIDSLQSDVAAILANNPAQDRFIVSTPTDTFNLTNVEDLDADNEVLDVALYINGYRQTHCTVGDFSTGAFIKQTASQIKTATVIPANAEVVVWKQGTAVTAGGGGATNLHGLTDVTLSSPQVGDTLVYNGSQWVNQPPASGATLLKTMQNLSGSTIPAGAPVAKLANGGIIAADSDGATTQNFVGIAVAAIVNNAQGQVAVTGQNIAGAITGLGFAPGQEIYLSQSGGYTNDIESFTDDDDSIIKIGIADCSAGAASATATDIIMFPEVLIRP